MAYRYNAQNISDTIKSKLANSDQKILRNKNATHIL